MFVCINDQLVTKMVFVTPQLTTGTRYLVFDGEDAGVHFSQGIIKILPTDRVGIRLGMLAGYGYVLHATKVVDFFESDETILMAGMVPHHMFESIPFRNPEKIPSKDAVDYLNAMDLTVIVTEGRLG